MDTYSATRYSKFQKSEFKSHLDFELVTAVTFNEFISRAYALLVGIERHSIFCCNRERRRWFPTA